MATGGDDTVRLCDTSSDEEASYHHGIEADDNSADEAGDNRADEDVPQYRVDEENRSKTIQPSYSAKRRTSKNRMNCVCTGLTYVPQGKIVVVTKGGQMFLFCEQGNLLVESDYSYTFESVATISDEEIVTSGEYFVKFFKLNGTELSENFSKEINYSYAGEPTIHAITSDGSLIVVSCNVQLVDANVKPFLRMFTVDCHPLRDVYLGIGAVPTRVQLCHKHRLLYELDDRKNAVVCVSYEGVEKWCQYFPFRPTDFQILRGKVLAVVTENSLKINYFDIETGKSVRESTVLPFVERGGYLLGCNRKDLLFLCRVDNETNEDVFISNVKDQSDSKLDKLTKLVISLSR